MPYKKLEIEEYLKTLKGYSEEQIENVRKVRTEWEYCDFAQMKFLIEQGQLKRIHKLKVPRAIFICPENGGFYYLNHYCKHYVKCAEWLN